MNWLNMGSAGVLDLDRRSRPGDRYLETNPGETDREGSLKLIRDLERLLAGVAVPT